MGRSGSAAAPWRSAEARTSPRPRDAPRLVGALARRGAVSSGVLRRARALCLRVSVCLALGFGTASCSLAFVRTPEPWNGDVSCNESYWSPLADLAGASLFGLLGAGLAMSTDLANETQMTKDVAAYGLLVPAVILSTIAFRGFYLTKRCRILHETFAAERAEAEAKRRSDELFPPPSAPASQP